MSHYNAPSHRIGHYLFMGILALAIGIYIGTQQETMDMRRYYMIIGVIVAGAAFLKAVGFLRCYKRRFLSYHNGRMLLYGIIGVWGVVGAHFLGQRFLRTESQADLLHLSFVGAVICLVPIGDHALRYYKQRRRWSKEGRPKRKSYIPAH
ncbi:MAG TPA: hypothetical protein VGB97_01430 [Candidatus Paceibacterota bacterium]|jgi:hypothetical protein